MENNLESTTSGQEDKLKKANEIKSSIKELESELKSIQNSCTHNEYSIVNCANENSSFSLRKVCKECQKEIGYPTQEEVENWVSS